MKRFGSLVLAAVLGSSITLAVTQWFSDKNEGVRLEYISGVPSSQVAYHTNEKGEVVPMDFTTTAEKVTKAVVHIRSTSQNQSSRERSEDPNDPFQFFFGPGNPSQRGPSQSSGSGVIINADGYIVTNNHVVQGADIVDVTTADNRTFKAEVIGTDPDTDLAVIKINEKGLPHLSFINSDESKVGQWVLAVGNPLNLNSTVTAGIISAKGRNIGIVNSDNQNSPQGRTAIESFIQTDAAINPGNSGGALVNLDGGLLGINTAIASTNGRYQGYGFAIPSNLVSKVVEDLLAYGTVQRGWLGIQVVSVNEELKKEINLTVNEGAFVNGFGDMEAKSAAKEAGIQKGDVIIGLDETEIKSSTALIVYIGLKRPGDKVSVKVIRDGKEKKFSITLKNREGKLGAVSKEEKSSVSALGIEMEDVDAKTLTKLDVNAGVKIKSLENNGKIARYTDMREGFIITHIDDKIVRNSKEVNEILKNKKPGDLITFSGIYEDYPREYIYAVRM